MSLMHLLRFSLVASALTLSAPAQADLIWGINGHPLVSYPGVPIERQIEYVRDLGLHSYRVDITGIGSIPRLHMIMNLAKPAGIEVLPVITPRFDLDATSSDVLKKQAYELAFKLVSAFKGEIPVWELANEFENYAIIRPCEMRDDGVQYSCAYGPAGGTSGLDYYGPRWAKVVAVLKGLTSGARDADPAVLRAVGTAGWGHTGAFERMQKDGIPWEITVWHMYGADPEWAFKKLVEFKKPIWVTEFNHPLGSQKSEQEQADGLAESMQMLRRYQKPYDVQAAHIYELLDEPYWAPGYEAYMGLVRFDKGGGTTQNGPGTPKIAYERIKQLVSSPTTDPATGQATTGQKTSAAEQPAEMAAGQPMGRHCALGIAAPGQPQPKDLITYAYCLTLGRNPDGAGLVGWTSKLKEHTPITEILVTMMQSQEFERINKVQELSPVDYARFIHHLLTDKEPDESTLQKLAGDLERGETSHADIQRAILASGEFKARHPALWQPQNTSQNPSGQKSCAMAFPAGVASQTSQVTYGYCLVLGRTPDAAGLTAYSNELLKGTTTIDFLAQLLGSSEFQTKYATDRLDDAAFVSLMYRLLLQREPDGAGLQAYVAGLKTGATHREQVWGSIVTSNEFHNKHVVLFAARAGDNGEPVDATEQP